MITLIKSLSVGKKVFGFLIKINLLILLVLTICTCNGPRLMLGNQILGSQTDYSLYSGKLARPIQDVMVYATLKTDGLVFHSWHQAKLLTAQQYQRIQDSVSYPSQDQMLKQCSQTKLYQSRLITRFSLNPYKMVWTDQKQSLLTEYPLANLLEKN